MARKGICAIAVLLSFSLVFALSYRAQETAAPESRPKIDQHWRVVPDVAPVDLQRQLEILNAQGIAVSHSEIVLVEDKFTIIISDNAGEEE